MGINILGEYVISILTPFFELFKTDEFAPTLSGCLILAAIGCLIPYSYGVWNICHWLRHQGKFIASIKKEDFNAKFREIETRLVESTKSKKSFSEHLQHSWKEFEGTLIRPDVMDDSHFIQNTVRPQTFFNATEMGFNFRIYRMLPGLFVGLGLLFTFLGLVSALHFATEGIQGGANVEQTQEALKNLLHSATFKFYTSVAGLGASMLFVIALRVGDRAIDKSFQAFTDPLERSLDLVTVEGIAIKQLSVAKEQRKIMSTFTTDMAVVMGEQLEKALNKSLPEHFNKALEPLIKQLQEFTGNMTNTTKESMQSMAEALHQELSGTVQVQSQNLTETLSKIQQSLAEIHEGIGNSGSRLAAEIGNSIDHTKGVLEETAKITEKFNQRFLEITEMNSQAMTTHINDFQNKLQQTSEQMTREFSENSQSIISNAHTQMSQTLSTSVDTLETLLQNTKEAFEQIKESISTYATDLGRVTQSTQVVGETMTDNAQKLQEATTPLIEITSNMSQASKNMEQAAQNTMQSIELNRSTLTEMKDTLQTPVESLKKLCEQYAETFDGIDGELSNAFEKINKQTIGVHESMIEFHNKLDSNLSDTVTSLVNVVNVIHESVEEMADQKQNQPKGN